jgi:type VI secretion system secreted protein Hcp
MAVDYFLKIDGIPGEADHAKHKDEIGVESFSWGAYTTGYAGYGGGGYGSGRAKAGDFVFSLALTKASPKLLAACAKGQHIKKAVVTALKSGKDQSEFLTWALEDTRITSYEVHGDGTAVRPREVVQIDAQRIQIEYKGQAVSGKQAQAIIAGWDFKTNRAITGDLTPPPKPKRKTKTKRRT